MADSWNKKEREKKKQQNKKDKEARKQERKLNAAGNDSEMIAYVNEHGHITDTPPDPLKRKEIKAEDIVIGVPPQQSSDEETIHTGSISFFNQEKGFGFIVDAVSRESVFVHVNNLSGPVKENDKVSFEIGHGPKGTIALNVKII